MYLLANLNQDMAGENNLMSYQQLRKVQVQKGLLC